MPTYTILGGCGFIGRNLVHRLANDETCTKLVVCDKSRPELSWLTSAQKESFDHPKVLFKQINLSNEANAMTFLCQNPCDFVINAAGETRLKCASQLYKQNIFELGAIAARAAVATKAKKYVQLSSARVKILENSKHRMDSVAEILKCQLDLEGYLGSLEGLNHTVLRTALVYGSGDKNGLMPILILMALYKRLKEKLKLLWTPDIHMETIHVDDVVSACLHALQIEKSGGIYELADKSHSTQGTIVAAASSVFGVPYKFLGKVENMLAKSFFEDIVEEINSKHMLPWSKACEEEGILNSPLYPYVTQEQLMLDDFMASGAEFEKTGFTCAHPTLEPEGLKRVIDEYVAQSIFPKSCAPEAPTK